MSQTDLEIEPGLEISPGEIQYRTSRSSGPGGQNVNKVETRVTLLFDLRGTSALNAEQRARIEERLATRINRDGILRVVSSRHRTQLANRNAATEKFVELLRGALRVETQRRPTRPSRAARARRLEGKRRRSSLKKARRRTDWD